MANVSSTPVRSMEGKADTSPNSVKSIDLTNFINNPMIDKALEVGPDISSGDDSSSDEEESMPQHAQSHNASAREAEFKKQLTCCRLFGCKGVVFMILLLTGFGLHFGVLFLLTHDGYSSFRLWNRQFLWVFMIFAVFYLGAFFRFVFPCYWKKKAKRFYERERKPGGRHKIRKKPKNAVVKAYRAYKGLFGLNGKFYLYRLHLFEFLENYVSFYNMAYIYLCSFPHFVCLIMMGILILESSYRAYNMAQFLRKGEPVSKQKRDDQISIDLGVDMIFLILPLLTAYFYGIRLSSQEICWILVIPSMSLFGKLKKMVKENIIDRADDIANNLDTKASKAFGRRRQSVFGQSHTELIQSKQGVYFNKRAKLGVLILSVVYVVAMLTVAIVQVAVVGQLENKCECFVKPNCEASQNFTSGGKTSWFSKGCQVKVPFCNKMFEPACNCAAFRAEDHDLHGLSKDFVRLTALRSVTLRSGPLEELPQGMEKLNGMTYFDLAFNRLNEFDVNVEKWDKLMTLFIPYNNVSKVHSSVWKHTTVGQLRLNSNKGLQLPNGEGEILLPELIFLNLANNSAILPDILGPEELPKIRTLNLNENRLRDTDKFPDGVDRLFQSVYSFGIARMGISILPEFLTKFDSLGYLDARDNLISNITKTSEEFLGKKKGEDELFQVYMSGNPGCSKGSKGLPYCEPLCSKYCYSASYVGDGECDFSCNSESCEFDGNDCL